MEGSGMEHERGSYEWKLLCVVRGYHVYKDVWVPYLEDDFTTEHQRCNPHDKYVFFHTYALKEVCKSRHLDRCALELELARVKVDVSAPII